MQSRLYLLIFDPQDDMSNFLNIRLEGFQSILYAFKPTIYLLEESESSRCRHMYKYELPENDSEKIPNVLNKKNVTSTPPPFAIRSSSQQQSGMAKNIFL